VLAYNGTRVFNTTELRALSAGQPTGGDAVVEIMRNGNRMQLTIPTGPMGVQVNGSRGTISTWRGN
jgi:S1-C subfamily serine protease